MIRKRFQSSLFHQLHDHIFRRTYQIISISQCQHIIQILVGSIGRILHLYTHAIGLIIPVLKIFYHGILADDVSTLQIDGILFVPVTFIQIFFPVADPECHCLVICCLLICFFIISSLYLHTTRQGKTKAQNQSKDNTALYS